MYAARVLQPFFLGVVFLLLPLGLPLSSRVLAHPLTFLLFLSQSLLPLLLRLLLLLL